MATDGPARPRLAPETSNPSSVAECSLCRHAPKARAVCLNWACTDLCGGRSAMTVPTAIRFSTGPGARRHGHLRQKVVRSRKRVLCSTLLAIISPLRAAASPLQCQEGVRL
jgi:hypothetical protein